MIHVSGQYTCSDIPGLLRTDQCEENPVYCFSDDRNEGVTIICFVFYLASAKHNVFYLESQEPSLIIRAYLG